MGTLSQTRPGPAATKGLLGQAAGPAIRWFKDLGLGDLDSAGGKGANLGELTRAQLPVPPGFVITAQAFLGSMEAAGVRRALAKEVAGLNAGSPEALKAASERMRARVLEAGMTPELRREIEQAYRALGDGQAVRVAVRSSATAEDTAGTSFAGMHETFTNVSGADAVIARVLDCWASLYGQRVLAYRQAVHLAEEPSLAVVVQAMVDSERSGVMFTVDPSSGDAGQVIVEAAFGLGEVVVGGKVEERTMKAARLHAYGEPLRLEEIPAPTPGEGEVVVRVLGAGFCHSDLHVMNGEIKIVPHFPLTLGHENAGVVAALGKGVTGLKEGDPVAVYGAWGCGICDFCVSGQEQLCEAPRWCGLSENDGGYAEYLRVPDARYLIPLTTLDPRQAAPLTDAALTPYRAVKRALPVLTPDHPALLIGLGGLGQYGLKLLQRLSGVRVIALDVSEEKLRLARALGAWKVVDGRAKDAADQVQALSGGKGVCAALDFVGAESTLALAVGATRSGGLVLHIGLAGGSAHLKPLFTSRFEVSYEASLWGTLKELRELIALVEQGGLTLVPSEVFPLEEINEVARRLKRGEVGGRAVIVPG